MYATLLIYTLLTAVDFKKKKHAHNMFLPCCKIYCTRSIYNGWTPSYYLFYRGSEDHVLPNAIKKISLMNIVHLLWIIFHIQEHNCWFLYTDNDLCAPKKRNTRKLWKLNKSIWLSIFNLNLFHDIILTSTSAISIDTKSQFCTQQVVYI